jgi:ribonuclease J
MIKKPENQENQNRTRTYVSSSQQPKRKSSATSTSIIGASAPKKKTFGNKPRAFSSQRNTSQVKQTNPQRENRTDRKPGADKIPALAKGDIRIIPLGGVEEIGRNMTMVEMNDQIIVIDAGIEFADEDNPGVNYIIPNTRYLEENKHKIKALVITHGHLDHIGGIPYLIDRIGNPPIYTREFGALLIKSKAADFPGLKLNIKIVEKDDGSIPISEDFKVRFFGLTHSIPDSTGVIIETPHGDIVSTADCLEWHGI